MDLDQIVADAQQSFEQAADITTLENEKARFLGKSGALTELLKRLGKLDPDTRKTEGARINVVKQQVEVALTARRQALADADSPLTMADFTAQPEVVRALARKVLLLEARLGGE